MNKDNRPECCGEREEKLKPCPFCGKEEAELDRNELRGAKGLYEYIVECQNCFAASGYCKTGYEAIKAWNTRHTEQPEGWVDIKKEKPTLYIDYLVRGVGAATGIGGDVAYFVQEWDDGFESPLYRITHWKNITPPVEE